MSNADLVWPQSSTYTLARARIPLTLLAAAPAGARPDAEGCALIDLGVKDGRIASLIASAQTSRASSPSPDALAPRAKRLAIFSTACFFQL